MLRQGKLRLGGGGVNALNESTILYGKAQNITDINYENITINPLNFKYPLSRSNVLYDNDLSSNEITFAVDDYYFKSDVDELFQKKLIQNFGVNVVDNKISVDFSKSGWTSNLATIYTDSSYVGIGTDNPIESLHIKNNNAAIIIDNNINKFKFANVDNYFSFGNDNQHNEILESDNFFKEQFKIHRDAPEQSLVIDSIGTVNINCNINVNNETYLTNKIFINNTDIINWLDTNGLATRNFVETSIIENSTNKINNLDYNNITSNKLTFSYPLLSNINNNNISVDLTATGWNINDNGIFTKLQIGIGTDAPVGLVQIGSSAYSAENPIVNDGTLILSKATSQNNKSFKLGFDNNFNFILGSINISSNIWNSQLSIYNSAPNNSLIIDNSGNVNINNSLNINSNINITGTISLNKFNINYSNNNFILGNSLLFLNTDGFVGIGTNPDSIYKFIVDGHIKTNNNFYGNDIFVNNGTFLNININSINVLSTIRSSNTIASNIISSNINNSILISTRNLLTSNLITSTTINTSNLNVFNNFDTNSINSAIISSSNLNILSNINTNSLISFNLNTTEFSTNNAIISNLNTFDIYAAGNIICDNNITSINNYVTNLECTNLINTPLINATTINGTSLTIANNILTSNLVTSNISTTNITGNIINANNNIITPTITSTNVNAVNITTTSLNATTNITANNLITGSILAITKINCFTQIALNITNPIADLHIGNSSTSSTNPSIMISSGSINNFKMGYDNSNNFIFGTYSRNTLNWTNQLSINISAPNNTININSSGNIGIGKVNDNTYKLDIDGSLNATKIYYNNELLLTTAGINSLITNNLTPYITTATANNLFTTTSYVNSVIDTTTSYIENTITRVLAKDSNIYTSQKRYPIGVFDVFSINYIPGTYNSIYGYKETISENIIENNSVITYNYEIYSSTNVINDKRLLFYYQNYLNKTVYSWGSNNYDATNISTFTDKNISTALKNSDFYNISSSVLGGIRYYGDYIIIKLNDPIILSKFIFYIPPDNIANAPGNWICYASNDAIHWTHIINASCDLNTQLNRSSYIKFNSFLLYYQKIVDSLDVAYMYYGFVFNKLVATFYNEALNYIPGTTLQLNKIELYGKLKIESIYVTTVNLNSRLNNYSTIDQLNSKLNKDITFTYPLLYNEDTQTLTYDANLLINPSTDATLLSNIIVGYIKDQTSIWKADSLNANNIYYTFPGCIGIGTTLINRTNISDLKLDIYGRIKTNNINADFFIGDGSAITNINYNNISTNTPDLKNLNNWNIYNGNIYSCNSGNVGIGYTYSSYLNAKLSVNGNIYATGILNVSNIQEDGIFISNKYLTILSASNIYFRNSGGSISGPVGINTTPSQTYMLNVNGNIYSTNINTDIINANTIQENNINISSKYLTISDGITNYLSKITGGIINANVTINSNLAIGTSISSDYRLAINGSFYASSNIVTNNNFIENGINLINKYLTISTASQVFLSNIGGVITENLTINSNLGIGITASSVYSLNVNGSFNATSIYNNGSLIDFSIYAIKTDIDTKFLLYPTLSYLDTNYLKISTFNSTISQYTKTGLDTTYLNVSTGGTVTGLTSFSNLFSSNLTSSNLFSSNLTSSNLTSSNINTFKLNVGSTSLNPLYSLNVDGSFNATSIYNNGSLINFSTYAIKTDIDTKFLLYPTFSYLDTNYITNTFLNSKLTLYSTTGTDPNYLKLSGDATISGNINFTGSLNSINIITSNLITSNIAINTNISPDYKLNVNGSIYSSNDIIAAGNLNEGGTNLINKYLTITNANIKYLSNVGGVISGSLGIGTGISSSYKLIINGSIYSSNIISCTNFNENGVNLIDKYLTITNATQNYLQLTGGTITNNLTINNNLGIGAPATSAYKLNVNGTIFCSDSIRENGILLSNKYLSLENGGSIIGNVGIGTSLSQLFKLTVNGSIFSSNDIKCAGNLNEGGVNLIDKYLTIANASQYLITGDFLNNQPNLQKKIGFRFVCNKPIILNNETYYKHDIDINQYVRNKIDNIDMTNYRIFSIKCFSTIGVFTTMTANKPPNILQYDVYMSSYPSINICAIGFPSNYYLNKITAGDICLLKTTNYNYISVVSKTNNNSISCIISDFLF